MLPMLALGGVQALAGGIQSILGAGQSRRARRALENLPSPTTTASASINDYYNRANTNPYATQAYQQQQNQINRGTTTGLSMLQDRRSGLAGISTLVRGQNDSLLRAGASAEQQQRAMLGDATRLKASDDQRMFQINKMLPFERKYSMLASKAAGGNQIMNSGLQNMFNGLGTAAMGFMGDGNGGNTGVGGTQSRTSGGLGMSLPTNIGLQGMGYRSPASQFGVNARTLNY